jgi:hypothetical protein
MKVSVLNLALLLAAGAPFAVSDDMENAFQSLKEAETKKDSALVKKLAAETFALARQAASTPAPEDAAEKQAWTNHVAYAKEIETHTEYALLATALQASDAEAIDLLSALEEQNPKSKYLDDAYGRYFQALNQTGGASKIQAVAEKAIKSLPDNEDLLMVLADSAYNRKQYDSANSYAERLIATMNKHPKPEGQSAADWERKKSLALGRGYWIAGLTHSEKTQFYDADKDLRAALPYLKGNEPMLAPALFYLGVANYQLGSAARSRARVLEAATFSEQAAAIKGPLSQQAWSNAQAMKAEAAKLR